MSDRRGAASLRGVKIALLAALAAALLVPAAQAKDRLIVGGCSESGDVCTSIEVKSGSLMFEITTAANYFLSYRLCVKGPKSKVCKTFPMREADRGSYSSKVRWRGNFPYQGAGLYKVTWQYSAKTLSFRLPL